MSTKRYTVTSALPYANGPLHIGHIAGAYLPADIYVRYLKGKGNDVAFVCGSDEHGAAITLQAKKEGIEVVPIPGPSAIITALSASGLASNSFSFFGFLPSKKIARIKYLQNKTALNETIIFYESPKRILATLTDMLEVFGNERKVCLAKELTKSFETIRTDIIENVIEYLSADLAHQKGEFVILISSADKIDLVDAENQLGKILPILCAEMGASKAAKLAAKITGIDKKHCYNKAIEL